jgi:copper resistance protein C
VTAEQAPGARDWLRLVPGGAVLVLVASVLVLAATVASRPARLDAADPADLARLAAPPVAVTLSFSGRLDPREVHVGVYDAAGRSVGAAAETVDREMVRRPVAIRRPGDYRVTYHAVFGDGRSTTGTLHFTITTPTTQPPAAIPAAPNQSGHSHPADPLTIVVIGLDTAAVTLAAVAITARRRRRQRRSWYLTARGRAAEYHDPDGAS